MRCPKVHQTNGEHDDFFGLWVPYFRHMLRTEEVKPRGRDRTQLQGDSRYNGC